MWVPVMGGHGVIAITANAYAYEAGLCEFDDPEDAFKAVNRAIMDNPSKYNAIDQNNNSIADSLESSTTPSQVAHCLETTCAQSSRRSLYAC